MTNITKKEENESRWDEIFDRANKEKEYKIAKMLEKLNKKGKEEEKTLSLQQK